MTSDQLEDQGRVHPHKTQEFHQTLQQQSRTMEKNISHFLSAVTRLMAEKVSFKS